MSAPVLPVRPSKAFVGLPDLAALITLKNFDQWVAWNYILKPGAAKLAKVPVNPGSGGFAKVSDPATWGSYEAAAGRAITDQLAGVGFMLTADDDIGGFDLDGCRDPDTGKLAPWAADLVALAETYVEVSPSGRGLRIFAQGKPAKVVKSDPAGVEVYAQSRYLTVTGQHLDGTPEAIRPAPKTLALLLSRVEAFRPRPERSPSEISQQPRDAALSAEPDGFFRAVNNAALANLDAWVPRLFPSATCRSEGAWRVTSADLGRDNEEDLSITPKGIVDFGVHDMGDARNGKRSPIDLVIEYGSSTNAGSAAKWLCEQLGVQPETLGWNGGGASHKATAGPRGSAPGFSLLDEWPEPKPLPSGLLPVKPFDPDMIPKAVAAYVMDIADRMQCPPDYVAVTTMVGLGTVLGRKIAIRPQRCTDWFEVPNLWGCIVGRPGAMKSPAMKAALAPLNRLEAEARKGNEEASKKYCRDAEEHKIRYEEAVKAARTTAKRGGDIAGMLDFEQPLEPQPRRYICNDTTYEAMAVLNAANPNGLLTFRDELMSLLKTLDREDQAPARGFYLTAWNGTSGYTFDRITRGVTHLDAACLSMLGSTQPGKLAAYIGRAVSGGAGDDGLIQRFSLLVWPDGNGTWREVDRYPDQKARELAFDAFVRLDSLTAGDVGAEQGEYDDLPFLRFGDAAADKFKEWWAKLERRLRGDNNLNGALESHLAKYRKLVPSLALLNHLADGGKGPVTEIAVLRALTFADYLESHARRAYSSGQQVEVDTAKAILSRIRKGDLLGDFTARDVLRHEWSNLSNREQVGAGLDLLDDLGWLRSDRIDTGGRPKMMFKPNPRIVT